MSILYTILTTVCSCITGDEVEPRGLYAVTIDDNFLLLEMSIRKKKIFAIFFTMDVMFFAEFKKVLLGKVWVDFNLIMIIMNNTHVNICSRKDKFQSSYFMTYRRLPEQQLEGSLLISLTFQD